MSRWIMSVDLGQSIDPTAIAVLEVSTRADAVAQQFTDPPGELAAHVSLDWFTKDAEGRLRYPKHAVRVDVRYLERLPLRMPYPDQIAHIAGLLRRPPLATPRAALVIDQTGVGRPVVDMLRRAGLMPIGVTITGGDSESRTPEGDYRVAKLLLVSEMQAQLNEGTLRIAAALPEARTLATEMQEFRANISDSGITRFGARLGSHDDTVLAVATGTYFANRSHGPAQVFKMAV
ncbi:MAG: hypothetical protein NTZ79_08795 [Proteobacteria bacterium]|nr:hypothetical protein [Pseudomonadota bacterium]